MLSKSLLLNKFARALYLSNNLKAQVLKYLKTSTENIDEKPADVAQIFRWLWNNDDT